MTFNNEKILVLGLGKDICGDDAIGLVLLQRLKEKFTGKNPNLDFIETTLSGLSLIDFLVGYEKVIILDAIQMGSEEGTIHKFVVDKEHSSFAAIAASPHFSGIHEIFHFGHKISDDFPKIIVILAVEISKLYEISEKLSPNLENILGSLIDSASK